MYTISEPSRKSVSPSVKSKQPLIDIANILSRNAGPTSDLKSSKAKVERNKKINELVHSVSFGDIKSKFMVYIQYI